MSEDRSPSERTNLLSRGKRQRHDDRGHKRNQRHDLDGGAPADQVGQDSRNEAAGKSADARARDIKPGDARDVARRPFVADIGDGDGEDRRQQEALHETPERHFRHAAHERHDQRRYRDREHRDADQALPAGDVGKRAGERRRDRDGGRAGGHQRGDFAGADMEFTRQFRQQRLRRVQIDKSRKARPWRRRNCADREAFSKATCAIMGETCRESTLAQRQSAVSAAAQSWVQSCLMALKSQHVASAGFSPMRIVVSLTKRYGGTGRL